MQQVFAADLSLFVQSNMAAHGCFCFSIYKATRRTIGLQINQLAKLNRCDYFEPNIVFLAQNISRTRFDRILHLAKSSPASDMVGAREAITSKNALF